MTSVSRSVYVWCCRAALLTCTARFIKSNQMKFYWTEKKLSVYMVSAQTVCVLENKNCIITSFIHVYFTLKCLVEKAFSRYQDMHGRFFFFLLFTKRNGLWDVLLGFPQNVLIYFPHGDASPQLRPLLPYPPFICVSCWYFLNSIVPGTFGLSLRCSPSGLHALALVLLLQLLLSLCMCVCECVCEDSFILCWGGCAEPSQCVSAFCGMVSGSVRLSAAAGNADVCLATCLSVCVCVCVRSVWVLHLFVGNMDTSV